MTSLLKIAKELLNTKDCLNPKIFDKNNHMLPDVRQRILNIVKLSIKQKIECLYGFTIADIVIVGSAAGYMYTASSDIDVKIFLETTNPTIKNLNHFTKYCCYEKYNINNLFYVNGLLLDISFGPIRYDNGGNYSILNDRWVTLPRKDNLAARFTPGEIIKGYYDLCARIYRTISEYNFQNGILTIKDIAYIDKMRRTLFNAKYDLEKDYDANIKKFLIYRLFVKKEKLFEIHSFQKQIESDFYLHKQSFNDKNIPSPNQE